MSYCAVSDILDYGSFTTTDAGLLLGTLIPRAEAIIEAYTGRIFECSTAETSTRYYEIGDVLDDGLTLMLDNDWMGVDSGATDGTNVIKAGDTNLASSNYVYLPRNSSGPYYAIQMKENSPQNWDALTSDGDYEQSISMKGFWCYSKSAPADIAHACVRLTYWIYRQRQTDADLDRPLLTGDGVTILPTRLPHDVCSILDRYKRVRLA
jgi:hypothetical protein